LLVANLENSPGIDASHLATLSFFGSLVLFHEEVFAH
jgi:hypothetical protein